MAERRRDGGEHERVGSTQEFGQAFLDLELEPRVSQQARPARVGALPPDLLVDRRDDLRVVACWGARARRDIDTAHPPATAMCASIKSQGRVVQGWVRHRPSARGRR
jgi:hypothetical protein